MDEYESQQAWDIFETLVRDMESAGDRAIDEKNSEFDDAALDEDLAVLRELERSDQQRKDAALNKRAKRKAYQKRGQINEESPFFDDD